MRETTQVEMYTLYSGLIVPPLMFLRSNLTTYFRIVGPHLAATQIACSHQAIIKCTKVRLQRTTGAHDIRAVVANRDVSLNPPGDADMCI